MARKLRSVRSKPVRRMEKSGQTRDAPDKRIQKLKYRKKGSSVISEKEKTGLSVSLEEKTVIKGAPESSFIQKTSNKKRQMMDLAASENAMERPEAKLKQKNRTLVESRGDSKKADTGGTTRPEVKKRLRFAYEETGAADLEKSGSAPDKKRRNSREQAESYQKADYFNLREDKEQARKKKLSYESERKVSDSELKEHSQKKKIYEEEAVKKKESKLKHEEPGTLPGKDSIPESGTKAGKPGTIGGKTISAAGALTGTAISGMK